MAPAVKALFFNVFGTLVDWRSSIAPWMLGPTCRLVSPGSNADM
jgi:hypothetical protein